MASAGGDAAGERPAEGAARSASNAVRPKLDRRAEALRANLKRRKAQIRARDEARPDDLPTSPDAPAVDA